MAENGDEHVGHLFLNIMKKRRQDDIFVIDGWTGERETVGGMLCAVVRLARALRQLGVPPGAPLALAGRNHIRLRQLYYAALLNGLPVVGMDALYDHDEVKTQLNLTQPKIAFVENDSFDAYTQIAKELAIDIKIVTFDEGESSLSKFLETYGDYDPIHDFQPAKFDLSKVYAWLVRTSGTCGAPKVMAVGHHLLVRRLKEFIPLRKNHESPQKCILNLGRLQWVAMYANSLAWPLANYTLLQTSRPGSEDGDHIVDLINQYKPAVFVGLVTFMSLALRSQKQCDFSCFQEIAVGGTIVRKKTITALRARTNGKAREAYGMSETIGPITMGTGHDPIGCVGTPIPSFTFKLVDVSSGKEIREPYVNGELWIRGPCFKEYFKNPQETANAFHEGWYKSGDLMYRDDSNRYYFVERMKFIIKYKNYHIIPSELEEVLLAHPAVRDVAVTGMPQVTDGQRAVACIVTRPGVKLTAQEIHHFVSDKLPEEKRLHGGVVFMDQLPINSGGKVNHTKLHEGIKNAQII